MSHDPLCYLYREDGECNLMADSTPLSTNVDTAPLSTNVDNMTHDQLCYTAQGKWDGGCQCDLIDKVRADTVEQIWLASKSRQAANRGES